MKTFILATLLLAQTAAMAEEYTLENVYIQTTSSAYGAYSLTVDEDIMPSWCAQGKIFIDPDSLPGSKAYETAWQLQTYHVKAELITYSTDPEDGCWLVDMEVIRVTPEPENWHPSDMILSQMVFERRLWAAGCPYPMRQGEMLYELKSKPLSGDVWAVEVGQMKQVDGSVCATVYTHVFLEKREYEWRIKDIYRDFTPWIKIDNPSR